MGTIFVGSDYSFHFWHDNANRPIVHPIFVNADAKLCVGSFGYCPVFGTVPNTHGKAARIWDDDQPMILR